jgi:putative ABC transport system permease protein
MRIDSLREAVSLAFDQRRSNKCRSALTILGIVVGVATVMTMSALITGIRSSIMDAVDAAGPRNFMVSRFNFDEVRISSGNERPAWLDNRAVSITEARQIAALDKVDAALLSINTNIDGNGSNSISVGKERVDNVQITGADIGWRNYTAGEITTGRDFIPAELNTAAPVIIISRPLAESLFGQLDPIGRPVRAGSTQFNVIGIFEMSGNIFSSLMKNFAIVPYTAATKYLGADPQWFDLQVVTAEHARADEAMDQVIATLRILRGLRPTQANDFAIMRSDAMIKMFDKLTGVFFIVMIALSSIGLMVGGVGVIAIMMISVTERTREIGIRKAIGATRQIILWQFLIEASTVTLVGGAVGMLCGGGTALLARTLTPIPASVPLWAVIAALITAAIAGVLFGLWPAWRASRLDPVAALRYE